MIIKLPDEIAKDPRYADLVKALGEVYVLPKELAERWRVTAAHLGNMRRTRKGPPWVKLADGSGGSVRYRLSDILRFEAKGYEGAVTPARIKHAVSSLPEFSLQEKGQIAAYLVTHLFPEK
jgi:hypothetical protein